MMELTDKSYSELRQLRYTLDSTIRYLDEVQEEFGYKSSMGWSGAIDALGDLTYNVNKEITAREYGRNR